ncbi:MAG: glycosyltransferase [Candidatus Altiarchaeota archaeon]
MASYSILIPVYNEADILEVKVRELMDFLDMTCPGYMIIVCSNGSTDGTDKIGNGIKHPNFRFLSISERGVGLAFKEMVRVAETEKLVSIDVDLTSDLKFIPECVKLLDEYNLVIGSKRKGTQERKWYRTLISGVFIALVRALLSLRFEDYSIGTKGWRRSDILKYVDGIDYGSSYVIELIYYVVKKDGKKAVEIPVFCSDSRGSKFNLVHEIFYRLKNLLTLWLRVRNA